MPTKEHQSSLSRFFKPAQSSSSPASARKRASSPIDLTLDDDERINDPKLIGDARPPKKIRVSDQNQLKLEPAELVRRDTKSRVYDASFAAPPISVTKPDSLTQENRVGDAWRRWAINSTSSAERADIGEDLKARAIRRKAYADRLSVRASFREERNRRFAESGLITPDEGREEGNSSGGDENPADEGMDISDGDSPALRSSKTKSKPSLGPTRSSHGKSKTKNDVGPSGKTWTPLEKQVLELKKQHLGVVLLIEVGYKFRFFGEDAKIASDVLGIVCFPHRNFLSASIPVHRKVVHIKRLLANGHKVGVVGQAETAALKKVSDNRSGPFVRKLTELYTSATFVGDMNSLDENSSRASSDSRALVCIVEQLAGNNHANNQVTIGLISIVPSTGDLVYDEFQDTYMRNELETRLTHIKPSEMLLPAKGLSSLTRKMLHHFINSPRPSTNSKDREEIRVEKILDIFDFSEAFNYLTNFYNSGRQSSGDSDGADPNHPAMAGVVDLPNTVTIALAHTLQHLEAFGLAGTLMETSLFARFTTRSHMLLNASTISNLEIYLNQTDQTQVGSLVWVLDKTKTRFGSRLLRSWIGKPLVDKCILEERVNAVQEILNTQSHSLDKLGVIIKNLPDLVKGLARIQYGKTSPKELATILEAYQKIGRTFELFGSVQDVKFSSPLLREIAFALPRVHAPIEALLSIIDVRKASLEEKENLWRDDGKFPNISAAQRRILETENALEQELGEARKILQRPTLQYVTVAQEEYMVEIPIASVKEVPSNWARVTATKKIARYRSPDMRKFIAEREQAKETLVAESDNAFLQFLKEVSAHYAVLRDATNKLAKFDCLNSLAIVARQAGYVKPEFVDTDSIELIGGRHPMIEMLRTDPFVPNNIALGGNGPRHKIITGPNMGGKSSFVRMTALIIIMAQIGSYVPATRAKLGLHDVILTRMGASDELAKGRSTFMVEISETSDILKICTPKSLVILDELGRGTSTFDGMSIAYAVMKHLVEEAKCKTLFITHYPLVANELGKLPDVTNGHMGFVETEGNDGIKTINFLYRLVGGMARSSFGIECAMLAGLPKNILARARVKSTSMEGLVDLRRTLNKYRTMMRLATSVVELDESDPGVQDMMTRLELLAEEVSLPAES